MTTVKAHERRITALEETVISHGETRYKLHRHSVKTDLGLAKVLDHLGLDDASEEDVDTAVDQELPS